MLNRLPPLNSIKAFHAACRHLNFSRAADELGVTQGAVSKQVLALEDFIGTKLFERTATGLELTVEGNSIKDVTLPAFDMLMSGFSRYERRSPRSQKVRISTLASFASSYLAPRLDRLEQAFPNIQLEILTSDRLVDHSREEIDFSIRYGRGISPDLVCDRIGTADLVPVCHPSFDLTKPKMRRLQVFSTNEWRAWEDQRGDRLTRKGTPIIVEEFVVAICAALSAQGMALLPELIVRDHIEQGRLMQFGEPIADWPYTYYIAMLPQASRDRHVAAVVDWLKTDIAGVPAI
ncbi:MAG: LysR substrate-binding domain-containing protein [Henriciella sp.]|nr:LysR substrate-binding domain-containing protein [Henriciella sp.]